MVRKIVFSVERELQSRTFIKLLNFEEKLYYYLLKLLFMCVPLKSLQIVRVYYEEMVLHMEIVLLMDIASFYWIGYRQWIVRATMEYSPSLNGCFPLTSTVVHIHCSTIRETFDLWITQIILEISRKYHN